MDPHSWNGIGNGATGDDDFENILSILDFPMESLEADGLAGDWDASKSQYLGPIPSDDVLMGPPVVSNVKTEPKPPILFPLPLAPPGRSSIKVDTATEVKPPLYQFSDSSSSNGPRKNKCTEVQEHSGFQSRSPVSVLESSTSSLAASGRIILTKFHINKRTRSRRARPLGCNPWLLISVPVVPSSGKTRKIKTMRKKPAQSTPCAMAIVPHPSYSNDAVEMQNAGVVKKCSHCEVTKTPQWREGPVGPKTLCNACGVRYRSGRLFPEYRPAASPTFVPTIHSNSHKKVLEMRNKGKVQVM